jgi:hypothetical protein
MGYNTDIKASSVLISKYPVTNAALPRPTDGFENKSREGGDEV